MSKKNLSKIGKGRSMNKFEITSLQNDLIKYCVKLQNSKFRKKEKMILADGAKTLQGFVFGGIEFEYLFIKKGDLNFENAKIKNLVFVTDEILKKISTTKTPTSAVGIIKEPRVDKNLFFDLPRLALIDGVKDAGNLGTIIRSAAAFSIDGIILFNDCVDLYNSKTIRATAQNIFKIPIITTSDLEFIKKLKQNHELISTVVDSKKDFTNYSFDKNFILALGSEACGISKEIDILSDEKLTISMDNNVESINLGVCASVAFALIKMKK